MQEGGALLVNSSSPHALPDSVQSPDCSGLSSGKSKKRERPDQNLGASKKDPLSEEYASPQKRECVGKFADEDGGLSNILAVDQLILKMKQVQALSQRSKLVGVVVATSKEDCLRKFVQMGGVSILEEWIQDGLKSRSSDASLKDSDKALDDEMLIILQALEKLPIDLEALKGCSIGKSVKQLRSVRNVELQKKARKLVDTWKKRVDFEMKQSSTMCAGAAEHSGHVDSMPRSSDLSPSRGGEGNELVAAMPSESIPSQEVNEALVTTTPNASTSDVSPKVPEKPGISSGKDASKKTTRLCSVSASTLGSAKRQKHSTVLAMDKDCKEEISNTTDSQKLKEKDLKCENGTSKPELNGNAACDTRKTNEYRKKLRSGGSSAAPCNTDLHVNVSPSNAVQARDSVDEKNACIDNNTGDSEQDSKKSPAAKCMNAISGNEAPDPPGLRSSTAGFKEQGPTEAYPQDGKTDHLNESCLSSQSSCTDKRTDTSPMVTFEMTKISGHTSQFQGDTKLQPLSKHLPQKIDGSSGGLHCPSMKSMSSTDDCSGAVQPELKPLNTNTATVLSKTNELADTQQGGAMDGEESCCSYDNVAENAQRGSAEYPSSHATLQKDAKGAGYSESNKAVVNICQESEKEQNAELGKIDVKANETPATTHSCHEFDLNEGLAMDEFLHDSQPSCVPHLTSTSNALSGSVKATSTLSAPVAVSAATKGAFIPPPNSMYKCDIGWKGSAATSAFRPAEPRHGQAKAQSTLPSNEVRNVNSFDLNVADQENSEDCLPSSGQRNPEAHLDLNCDGKDAETDISTSISESATHLPLGSGQNLLDKRPVHDFDLNEQLDEVQQEQEVLSTSVARRLNSVIPFGGPGGCAPSGDIATWHSAGSTTFPVVSANIARTDQFFTGSMNHLVNSRQTTSTTLGSPPMSSVVYSQTAPFFGGPQIPFPASFGYSPAPARAESPFLVSQTMPSPVVSTVGGRSRPEASFVRPTFGTSTDDLRGGGNGFYSWGRPHQNMYNGSAGPTIISYNDAAIGGREHLVNFDGSISVEEQMRLYQQAAVPVTSLKRKDSDYFSGLRQSTWH